MEYSTVEISGEDREKWIRKNSFYYKYLVKYLKYSIPEGSSILEIGCGTGFLLRALNPSYGVGIDKSVSMIDEARKLRPENIYHVMNAESLELNQQFDFVLISDTVGDFRDVQNVFSKLQQVCAPETRIIITTVNFLWYPLLKLGEKIGRKMPQNRQNWLDVTDLINLLNLENFELISHERKMIFPAYLPLLSSFFNGFIGNLPLFNRLGLINCLVARHVKNREDKRPESSVSIVIPARNEQGNIESLVLKTPRMGRHTEIIFIEGNSTDDTWGEIQRVCERHKDQFDLKYAKQDGKGKGDAVRKGFSMATGDILMILDADMTVPPEDLPKFYDAIHSGKGEYINGTRLVYPMEDEAMRTLNLIGNKFFSLAFSWLLGQPIKDTLCGTKVLSRKNYTKLAANRSYFGDFDPFGDFDLIFGSSRLHLKFIEVPIRYKARTYGSTNISRFRHGWILLKMTFFALNKIKFI